MIDLADKTGPIHQGFPVIPYLHLDIPFFLKPKILTFNKRD